ncbi:hypothetical protein CBR_g74675 [Chara braunii]|uniref:Uncharacterized protein n=1 Tax=Chara braunii TaxID=69332 RepID=A0A388KAE2_CHABU|nr:hypothetical protein CBR_g74675 [Chara braunii]|eukprot:GBG66989.1 hypothetical protein CBR_g74675 [Chara braunii]
MKVSKGLWSERWSHRALEADDSLLAASALQSENRFAVFAVNTRLCLIAAGVVVTSTGSYSSLDSCRTTIMTKSRSDLASG